VNDDSGFSFGSDETGSTPKSVLALSRAAKPKVPWQAVLLVCSDALCQQPSGDAALKRSCISRPAVPATPLLRPYAESAPLRFADRHSVASLPSYFGVMDDSFLDGSPSSEMVGRAGDEEVTAFDLDASLPLIPCPAALPAPELAADFHQEALTCVFVPSPVILLLTHFAAGPRSQSRRFHSCTTWELTWAWSPRSTENMAGFLRSVPFASSVVTRTHNTQNYKPNTFTHSNQLCTFMCRDLRQLVVRLPTILRVVHQQGWTRHPSHVAGLFSIRR